MRDVSGNPHSYIGSLVAVGLCVLLAAFSLGCREESAAEDGADKGRPAAAAEPRKERHVKHSSLAGTWYDADPAALRRELSGYLEAVPGEPIEGIRALVLPHAGYRWSGAVAAHGARQVQGRTFSRVVVLGPSHHVPLENVVSVPHDTHYGTPLGEVPIDTEFLAALERHGVFQHVPSAHAREHSVQIQVPMLQQALGSFRLAPLVVGDLDTKTARRVADILLDEIDEDTLVVVSSDFTHYGHGFRYVPFDEDVPERLETLDMGAYAEIEKLTPEGFLAYVNRTGATICGRRPIEVLLHMLPADAGVKLLRYARSGDATGDFHRSVSYMAIAFQATWPDKEGPEPAGPTSLAAEDKQALARLARRALEHALEFRDEPSVEELGVPLTPALRRPQGSFVTLRRDGRLRGCIGEIHPRRPLYKSVMGTAVSAGTRDRRFAPVTPDELPEIDIKISVLTPPSPVGSWEEIVIGKHGIVLTKDGRSATFLPQVAPEQGWNLETTLTHLSKKAGLPGSAWRRGATFLVFEAEVFGEKSE